MQGFLATLSEMVVGKTISYSDHMAQYSKNRWKGPKIHMHGPCHIKGGRITLQSGTCVS